MLRRSGFRRILPLAQLALYIALVITGYEQQRRAIESTQPKLHPIAFQQNVPDWHPATRPPLPISWQTAIGLNVPACIFGGMIATLAANKNSDVYTLLFSIPFVPLLWLLIGRWLDYQLRYLPRPPRSIVRIVFYSIGIIISLFGIYAGGLALNHNGLTGPTFMTLAWSCFVLLICITALLRDPALLEKESAAS